MGSRSDAINAGFWRIAYPPVVPSGVAESPPSEAAESGERPMEGGLLWLSLAES